MLPIVIVVFEVKVGVRIYKGRAGCNLLVHDDTNLLMWR